jgi:hypothetical protein
MDDLVKLGSDTAKGGFKNEDNVIERFNNWENDELAQGWLVAMNYVIDEIEYVRAEKIKGSYKADVQVQVSIEIKLKKLIDTQNLQVKLVSNPQGFNQIDKRWVDKYVELWNIPQDITQLLKYFTGEIEPSIESPRDSRRMFINELEQEDQKKLVKFIQDNKTLIVSDILKGRGKFSAEWMLVILKIKDEEIKWALKPMNFILNFYGNGDVEITKQGSIKIGKITIQRKGGDGGRDTAKMLQFKINPSLLVV